MIMPRLCINGSKYRCELYYPDDPDNPIAIICGSARSVCETFMNILNVGLENYMDGYNIGYTDAIEEMEEGELNVGI